MERLVVWHRARLPSPDTEGGAEALASWTRNVSVRMLQAGGAWMGTVGGTTVAGFDLIDAEAAVDLCLSMLDECDSATDVTRDLRVTFGITVGTVEETSGPDEASTVYWGEPIDRAQFLASSSSVGQVVLDEGARELVSATFLFLEGMGTAASVTRGYPVDRRRPLLSTCRAAIAHLRAPPVAPSVVAALDPIRAKAREPGSHRLVIRGSSGGGSQDYLRQLRGELRPGLHLAPSSVPGGLEPLGSLRLGLVRAFGSPAAVEHRLSRVPDGVSEILGKVARGEPVARGSVIEAMVTLLRTAGAHSKPWVVLDPVSAIDTETLKALDAVMNDGRAELLLISRLPMDARLPPALGAADGIELRLPYLRSDEALAYAAAILGDEEVPDEIAETVALHGGDTPLGILEAARAMVATGDLVHDGGHFAFRLTAPTGVGRIPLRHLLDMRLKGLDTTSMRLLEIVAAAPSGFGDEALLSAAEADGLGDADQEASLKKLEAEAFVQRGRHVEMESEALRAMVLRNMPPARLAELHRFLARAMDNEEPPPGAMAGATVGFYLAEGGEVEQGSEKLLRAAAVAAGLGYERSAVRLAASAVQYHPTDDTRMIASRVTRAVGSVTPLRHTPGRRPPSARPSFGATVIDVPAIPDPSAGVGEDAIRAVLGRDLDRAERQIEMAIAEGRSLAAADRLRAMVSLLRGDRGNARKAFSRARSQDNGDAQHEARTAVLEAWLLLGEGRAEQALRSALQALSIARQLSDRSGEAASLRTLSVCFRALGRTDEAESIARAALS